MPHIRDILNNLGSVKGINSKREDLLLIEKIFFDFFKFKTNKDSFKIKELTIKIKVPQGPKKTEVFLKKEDFLCEVNKRTLKEYKKIELI